MGSKQNFPDSPRKKQKGASKKLPLTLLYLAVLIQITLIQPLHAAPPKPKNGGKELKKSLTGIRGKKHEARLALIETRTKAHSVKLDIQTVDNRLEAAHTRLENTQGALKASERQSVIAAASLVRANEALLQTRKQVEGRIRRIYMQGAGSAISALSGTRAGGEVASNSYMMSAIEHKDRDVFNRYIALQKDVAAKKKDADARVREVTNLQARETVQARSLAEVRQTKASLLNKLRSKEQDLEGMIAQFQKDEEQIGAEIEAFERRMAAERASKGSHYGYRGVFAGRFIRPVGAPITSTFGMRYHPILRRVRMHTGIDFGAAYGTPIHAAATGQVIFSSFMNGYGHVVIIDHGGGFSTVYAHASRVFVSVGQRVTANQVIAAVGASGLATGPHLHFEVRLNGHAVNPLGKM